MPDGDMRRPPRLWEQRLQQLVSVQGLGLSSAASAVVSAPAPGPGGGDSDVDPPPVLDEAVGTPRVGSDPVVSAAIGGLQIIWDGLDSAGFPVPSGTTAQVHVSDSSGFTPSSSTLEGVLQPAGSLVVTGLTSGTTYYVVFVLVSADGTELDESAESSAAAGFVLSTDIGTGEITADLVSFDAAAIGGIEQFVGTTTPPTTGAEGSTWINTSNGSYYTLTGGSWVQRQWDSAAIAANAISTTQLAAGAITAGSAIIATAAIADAQIGSVSANKLTAGTIDASVITVTNLDADNISTGTLSGNFIDGGTIEGATFQTKNTGTRTRLVSGDSGIQFLTGNTLFAEIVPFGFNDINGNSLNGAGLFGSVFGVDGHFYVDSYLQTRQFHCVSSAAFFPGCVTNAGATTGDAGFNGNRLRQKSSTQRLKYDISEVSPGLDSIDPLRRSDVQTVDPFDVLNVGVAEFTWVEEGEGTDWRELGFIAEDVHEKFPIAVGYDADGLPFNVRDTPMIAALVAVVKDQQDRIAALEAKLP